MKSIKEKKFFRDCPNPDRNINCRGKIGHISEQGMLFAKQKGKLCNGCRTLGSRNGFYGKHLFGEANGFYGKKHKKETVEQMSLRSKKENLSEDTLKRMSDSHKGKKDSDETRKKKSIATKGENNPFYGKQHTNETKDVLKQLHKEHKIGFYDRQHTDETKKKQSEAHKNLTEEQVKKRTEILVARNKSNIGRITSDSTKKKLSDSLKGRLKTEQHRINIGIGEKKAFAEGRQFVTAGKISGCYKNLVFRSTSELLFITLYSSISSLIRIDGKGLSQYRVKYIDNKGQQRTYIPDYFDVNLKIIYEIKPVGYKNSDFLSTNVKQKENYAILYYDKLGWKYQIVEMLCLDKKNAIFPLRQQNQITLTPKWEKQYQEWLITKSK